MGDRALVVFCDEDGISPTVYLHWHGSSVPELLGDLAEYMKGRYGDAAYAAARFIGLCHKLIPGHLSLGIQPNTLRREDLGDGAILREMSHGDAGVVIVNTDDFTWKAYGGYLAQHRPDTAPDLTSIKPSSPNE